MKIVKMIKKFESFEKNDPLLELRKRINSRDEYDMFLKFLYDRVKSNSPISKNTMLDGMIIGFIFSTPSASDLILGKDLGRLLDGTIQRLEQIGIWLINNQDEILRLLDE
jgi:hypothetical protein